MANTQLQLSQLSYQDATDEEKHSNSCALSEIREDTTENEKHEVEPSYQRRLSLLRFHLVGRNLRATMSLVDLVVLGV